MTGKMVNGRVGYRCINGVKRRVCEAPVMLALTLIRTTGQSARQGMMGETSEAQKFAV